MNKTFSEKYQDPDTDQKQRPKQLNETDVKIEYLGNDKESSDKYEDEAWSTAFAGKKTDQPNCDQ